MKPRIPLDISGRYPNLYFVLDNFQLNTSSRENRTHDYVRAVDHNFFNAHPGTDVFLREFIVGEFHETRLPFRMPPLGSRFAVHVHAFRDPCSGAVIMRTRSFMVVSCETPLQWYVGLIVKQPGARR